MEQAFREAEKAYEKKEIPIGAVLVFENKIIGRGHNLTETLQDPTAHAEMIAITAASEYMGSKRLLNTAIYVTTEPCAMCAGAIVLARIKCLYYGTYDPKTGACGSVFDIPREPRLNHHVEVYAGLAADQASRLLEQFFDRKRKEKQRN